MRQRYTDRQHTRMIFGACVAGMLFLAAGLHFWRIGSHPPGLFHDESAIMYNAWSIAQTGADEYGVVLPLFFRSFDNYHDPVMVYATAPLTAMFGLRPWTGRALSALFHLAAGAAFFLLIGCYVQNRWLALTGAFCFTVLPWAFPLSRIVMAGYTPMLLGMTAGMFLLLEAYRRRNMFLAAGAGVAWAFAMYSHNIGRPMTALYLICFCGAYAHTAIREHKISAAFIIAYVAALIPMIISVIMHPEALTTRFSALSVWHDAPGWWTVLQRIGSRYLDYFLPRFLFITGDSNLRHHTGAAGLLYAFMLPLILTGLFVAVRKCRQDGRYLFLLLTLLTYPAAAVLTMDRMHSTRTLSGAIVWTLTGVIGAAAILKYRRGRLFLAALAIVASVEVGLYMHDYFTEYATRSRPYFNAALSEALDYAFAELAEHETLNLSQSIVPFEFDADFKPHLYVQLLFYSRLSPGVYQRSGIPDSLVTRYGNSNVLPGLLLRNRVRFIWQDGQLLIVPNTHPVPAQSRKLAVFPVQNSDVVYEIYRLEQ